jgi:hypothetical protein
MQTFQSTIQCTKQTKFNVVSNCGAPSLNKIKHGHELNTCASKQLDLRTSSFMKNKKIDYSP